MSQVLDSVAVEDSKLRKNLGYWSLVGAGLGGVIGSGWLFSALYAAQAAGPAALVAWVVGGLMMLAVGLVFAELAIERPESGGLVRYPLYSNGRFAAGVVGWCIWVSYLSNPPIESAGVLQYASTYLPGIYQGKQLTGLGILLAIGLMAIFVLINYFGVQLFAKTNNTITTIKVLIPATTAVLLIVSGFDTTNVTAHGGFAPYGFGAALGTIASAGIVYAYTGFDAIVELAGEVRHPRRHIPAALITTLLVSIVLYLALQAAFVGAVPNGLLAAGWRGVNLDSPFAQLAMFLGLSWLLWILLADSILSPAGSGICCTASNSRIAYALAKNGFLPDWIRRVHEQWGVPGRALVLNFVIGVLFLLPLPSWQQMASVTSTLVAFAFAMSSVSLMAFRRAGITKPGNRLFGMALIAPVAFVVSSLIFFWASWSTLVKTLPIMGIGMVWYALTWLRQRHGVAQLRGGGWLIVHLAVLYLLSGLGSFDGLGLIRAPWDSVTVAVVSLGLYLWGVASGVRYLRETSVTARTGG